MGETTDSGRWTRIRRFPALAGIRRNPYDVQHQGVWLINPGALASGNAFTVQTVRSVARLRLEEGLAPQVTHVNVSAPGQPMPAEFSWPQGFLAAAGAYSRSIFEPSLQASFQAAGGRFMPAWHAHQTVLEGGFLRAAHRVWSGEQAFVSWEALRREWEADAFVRKSRRMPVPRAHATIPDMTTPEQPLRVLALCLGNICRSPLAEGLLRRELMAAGVQAVVDSAGTGDWHVGHPADPRSRQVARAHGLELAGRARQLTPRDFHDFDLILAMDQANARDARALAPAEAHAQVRLMREWDALAPGADVPDPYYGGPDGFEQVYQMLERSARAFAAQAARTA